MDKIKVKKIVFDDTDIRHAQLRIRLQNDGLSQAEFFRALITGYIEKDKNIIKYIVSYMEKRGDSKRKVQILKKDLDMADHLMGKFGIEDEELENIFDLIAEENPDL
jgi:succinate dehydrogenase flavin-adding protein (antitoxin of CptAB toxin-antitoxin module)|tara:strand:- start:461 stop:781 length:321 start_codon:yes stop_codon:yes gene_type:complete